MAIDSVAVDDPLDRVEHAQLGRCRTADTLSRILWNLFPAPPFGIRRIEIQGRRNRRENWSWPWRDLRWFACSGRDIQTQDNRTPSDWPNAAPRTVAPARADSWARRRKSCCGSAPLRHFPGQSDIPIRRHSRPDTPTSRMVRARIARSCGRRAIATSGSSRPTSAANRQPKLSSQARSDDDQRKNKASAVGKASRFHTGTIYSAKDFHRIVSSLFAFSAGNRRRQPENEGRLLVRQQPQNWPWRRWQKKVADATITQSACPAPPSCLPPHRLGYGVRFPCLS